MSDSWSAERDDARREEASLNSRLYQALRKLTDEQVAELPTRELIALAIKARRG